MTVVPPAQRQQQLMALNRDQYGEIYQQLNFVTTDTADHHRHYRQQLLDRLASARFQLECRQTKPHTGPLSPGCRLCSEGRWSCLFINGRCNLSCFYCPGSQDDFGQPTTNNLSFSDPAAYVDYLRRLDFRGMSLSGGEPLLTLQRTIDYLSAAKKTCGDELHCWLYTNGSLVTDDILKQLRDCGLDEIRFDIGAVNYSLDKVALAVGIIPNVTIEIPAVPEEVPLLKDRMHRMAQIGVDFLNLHQLRLTPYNHPRFVGRPYSYLHGEKITVLESELAALELMLYGQEQGIDLPVNYCSFVFKNRFQQAAARGRGGNIIGTSHEQVTAAGYLRSCLLKGETERLRTIAEGLGKAGIDKNRWRLSDKADQLHLSAELLELIDSDDLEVTIRYAETPVRGNLSYRYPFREIKLAGEQKIVVERITVKEAAMPVAMACDFLAAAKKSLDAPSTEGTPWEELLPFELPESGLQVYF